jgi:hypothetical protein
MFPVFIIYFPVVMQIPHNIYRQLDPTNEIGEPIYQQPPKPEPKYTPEQVLYQPLTLFPVQMLPYQYYQIIRGKFLIPTAFSLAYFFTPEFPFSESSYKEFGFKEPLFMEKGEYAA